MKEIVRSSVVSIGWGTILVFLQKKDIFLYKQANQMISLLPHFFFFYLLLQTELLARNKIK